MGVSWEEWVSRVSGVGVILGQRVGRPDWPEGQLGRGPAGEGGFSFNFVCFPFIFCLLSIHFFFYFIF